MANLDPFGLNGGAVTQGVKGGSASANVGKTYDPFNVYSLPATPKPTTPQQQTQPQKAAPKPTSLFGKLSHAAQDVAKGAEKTVKAVARPVADVVTGQGGKAVHDTAQLASDVSGGTVNQLATAAKYTPQMIAADATSNAAAQRSTQKKAFGTTNSGDIAKKIVGSTVGAATLAGGGEEAAGVKGLVEAGAKTVAKKVAKDAALGATGNAAMTVNQNPDASGKQVAESAAVGGAIGGALPVAAKVFKAGASKALEAVKKESPEATPKAMEDVMTPEQADQAAAAAHTQIVPKDESAGAEQVGVRTPVRPGIKQQSETYKVGVRTPTRVGIKQQSAEYNIGVSTHQTMTDDEYTKEFNSLSNAYDKEMKSVEGKPPVTQQALAGHIDNKYQVLIGDLNDRYKNGSMTEAAAPKRVSSETSSTKTVSGKVPAPKRIASETSKAEKTTGGAPESGVNVPRSSKYNLSGAPRITPEEATTKLQSAGYSPDETKTILQDALPEKGLAMPGSKPQVKLNDESIQKSAVNLDKTNGETMPESSNLRPLAETSTSEKGTSKLASSVQEGALQDKLVAKAEAEGLPSYNKANMKEQAQFTSELIKSDPQHAINIALGKEEAPAHILPQMVYNGVEEYARHIGGDDGAKLLLDLSHSKQVTNLTTMAQNVRAAAERDPHSPTNMINEVAVARAGKVKGGIDAATKAIKDDAKSMKAATPKIKPDDWQQFVNGLRC